MRIVYDVLMLTIGIGSLEPRINDEATSRIAERRDGCHSYVSISAFPLIPMLMLPCSKCDEIEARLAALREATQNLHTQSAAQVRVGLTRFPDAAHPCSSRLQQGRHLQARYVSITPITSRKNALTSLCRLRAVLVQNLCYGGQRKSEGLTVVCMRYSSVSIASCIFIGQLHLIRTVSPVSRQPK